ncbi:MAG: lytic transglycosylase domain-containing protein [Bryobacteraceae bacterium]|jgi:soluble lytic murein transglycosylase-like protein
MESSIARQRQAVAAMQIPIEKQRAAVNAARPGTSGGVPAAAAAPFFTLSWPALGAECDPLPEIELSPLIEQAAQQAALDPNLLRAVARQESGFRSCAVSQKGAMGLMQLMPATVQELGVRDPFDPAENLSSGARLLKQLLTRFGGDTALALGAYNAGPGRVEESGGVPEIPETLHYVQQILSQLPIP